MPRRSFPPDLKECLQVATQCLERYALVKKGPSSGGRFTPEMFRPSLQNIKKVFDGLCNDEALRDLLNSNLRAEMAEARATMGTRKRSRFYVYWVFEDRSFRSAFHYVLTLNWTLTHLLQDYLENLRGELLGYEGEACVNVLTPNDLLPIHACLLGIPFLDYDAIIQELKAEVTVATNQRTRAFNGETQPISDWIGPKSPKQWVKVFDCSWDTIKRRIEAGKIRVQRISAKSYSVHRDDLPNKLSDSTEH